MINPPIAIGNTPVLVLKDQFVTIHKKPFKAFRGLKKFQYNYTTQMVRIVVTKFNNTTTIEYPLKGQSTTRLQQLEEEFRKIH
jgi:hypothetical protein